MPMAFQSRKVNLVTPCGLGLTNKYAQPTIPEARQGVQVALFCGACGLWVGIRNENARVRRLCWLAARQRNARGRSRVPLMHFAELAAVFAVRRGND